MPSIARSTLSWARHEVNRLEWAGPNDRDYAAHALHDAVVNGLAVTHHLHRQFARVPGYWDWWQPHAQRLKEDRLCRYFYVMRSVTLKHLHPRARHDVTIQIDAGLVIVATAGVIRGSPWYRRPLRILVEDLLASIWRSLSSWKERLAKSNVPPPDRHPTTTRAFSWRFHPPWDEEPAVVLLRRWLDELEKIVGECEEKFLLEASSAGRLVNIKRPRG
jgi:hypothetical protein